MCGRGRALPPKRVSGERAGGAKQVAWLDLQRIDFAGVSSARLHDLPKRSARESVQQGIHPGCELFPHRIGMQNQHAVCSSFDKEEGAVKRVVA